MTSSASPTLREPASSPTEKTLAGQRVIFVLVTMELGGSERQALLLARYLKEEQQVDVEVWAMIGSGGQLASLCDSCGIRWRIVPFPWVAPRLRRPAMLARFARRLRQARPDIILPYMEMPNLVCGLVWPWTGARLCVWNQRDDGIARLHTRYERRALENMSRFISNSAQGAEHLVNDRGVPRDKIRIIHNGIELAAPQATRAEWRQRLGICEDSFLACMVANMTGYKDHVTLLKSWRLVIDRLRSPENSPTLLLAGRMDTTGESLKALAYDLDLRKSVRFLGPVSDVSGLLTACDLGLLCSNSEGSSNSVLEYMAARLAVAGTDIPSMREVLSDENHAFLAPCQNAETLSTHITKLALDREMCTRLGALNRQKAESEFSARGMCEETLDVIVDGLRERR